MGQWVAKPNDRIEDPLDMGPCQPQGLYETTDYDTKVVKRLLREGRLAPFYKGYQEERPFSAQQSQVDRVVGSLDALLERTSEHRLLATATRLLAARLPEHIQQAVLYKDTVECPICLLYYPTYINRTRCCRQPICTECFLQLKRKSDSPMDGFPCPFCKQSHLGVIRTPPPWTIHYLRFKEDRAETTLHRLTIRDPDVVLVDHVRPNWQLDHASCQNRPTIATTRRVIVRPPEPRPLRHQPSPRLILEDNKPSI
ncbi:hypothetical protein BC940DRAFT_333592 [Gongronella butleri]|nr:hypothetical protein BC940DRAFT_333592 [Gongronella butleri]